MTRDEWFGSKWLWLKRLALLAVVGVALAGVGIFADMMLLSVLGALLVVPLLFWLAFIPILHWKDRYVGGASPVWGAFLFFETSSWAKLVYWFVHVLPDWRRSGRYACIP